MTVMFRGMQAYRNQWSRQQGGRSVGDPAAYADLVLLLGQSLASQKERLQLAGTQARPFSWIRQFRSLY